MVMVLPSPLIKKKGIIYNPNGAIEKSQIDKGSIILTDVLVYIFLFSKKSSPMCMCGQESWLLYNCVVVLLETAISAIPMPLVYGLNCAAKRFQQGHVCLSIPTGPCGFARYSRIAWRNISFSPCLINWAENSLVLDLSRSSGNYIFDIPFCGGGLKLRIQNI